MPDLAVPDRLPLLSRGKHRNPRKGACFMELASYLAGERWSDHPACTHPLLAAVARGVNDFTSDSARSRLAVLIPSVIGLTGDDPRLDVAIALRCAGVALPVAPAEQQRVLAVGVLAGERVLAELDGRPRDSTTGAWTAVVEQAPQAAGWARRFSAGGPPTPSQFARRGAPTVVQVAIRGIVKGCGLDTDALLYEVLAGCIEDCRALLDPPVPVAGGLQRLAREFAG